MDEDSTKGAAEAALFAGEAWFDPVEAGLRGRIRGLIEEMIEQEFGTALGRGRYGRGGTAISTGPKEPVSRRSRRPCRWPRAPPRS